MINREEISKNIQRLLQGYADTSNDIKVTIRTPKEVDVYIDGELFNTYLIEEKKFKNNIVQSRKKDDDFKITIILSRDDLAERKSQYIGALPRPLYHLTLPMATAKKAARRRRFSRKAVFLTSSTRWG